MENKQNKKLTWGDAKIEFVALLPEINDMLYSEYPKTKIYAELIDNKKITMSYRRFCELICETFPDKIGRKKSKIICKNTINNHDKNEKTNKCKQNTNIDNNKSIAITSPHKCNIVSVEEEKFENLATSDELKQLMGG